MEVGRRLRQGQGHEKQSRASTLGLDKTAFSHGNIPRGISPLSPRTEKPIRTFRTLSWLTNENERLSLVRLGTGHASGHFGEWIHRAIPSAPRIHRATPIAIRRGTVGGRVGRLSVHPVMLARIGEEVDRLKEDEGASLEPDQPIEYERDDLAEDIEYLATFPQAATARDLGLTERGWRKVIKTRPRSKAAMVERIREVAALW